MDLWLAVKLILMVFQLVLELEIVLENHFENCFYLYVGWNLTGKLRVHGRFMVGSLMDYI